MAEGTQLSMQALQSSELAPVVAQVINHPHVDLLEWHVYPVAGVGGSQMAGGQGIFRLTGSARASGQVYPWSVIVKLYCVMLAGRATRDWRGLATRQRLRL